MRENKVDIYFIEWLALVLLACFGAWVGLWMLDHPKLTDAYPNWVHVECSECDGTAVVFYGPEHFIVAELGFESKEYPCPICNGGRNEIWQERR